MAERSGPNLSITRRSALLAGLAAGACGSAPPAGDTLRVATGALPDSLDPARGQFASAALIYKQVHAGLTDYGSNGQLAPGLAEHWEASPDGLAWTFTLRPDLRWSDGHPLSAEDIAWSALRLVDPAQSFAILGDFQNVTNARAITLGDAPADTLGVDVLDDRRIRFRLDQPLGLFPILMREFYPFPRHVIEAVGDDWVRPQNWVSAGAYTVRAISQVDMYLARNPNYYGADQVRIPEIHVQAIRDDATRVRMFRADEVDIADNPPGNQIEFLRAQLGSQFQSFDAPILRYLKLNHDRAPLNDLAFRTRLNQAVDRAFLAREVFSGTATPTPRSVIIGASQEMARPAAAELEINRPDRPLEIRTTIGVGERIAVSLADDWRQIGIETEILTSYPTDLYQAVDAGEFDIAVSSFNRGLKTDPFFMLDPFAPDGFAANFNWQDDVFADLMEAARREDDPQRRAALYGQADERLYTQAAITPLVHERAHWLIAGRVEGTRPDVQPQLWRDLSLAASE